VVENNNKQKRKKNKKKYTNYANRYLVIVTVTSGCGLQQRPTSPIAKKYSTLKIKMDNEAVQKLQTS